MADSKPWYLRPVRVLQFNIEDRYGVYVSKLTGSELVKLASDLGANVLVIFARDPWGRTYYRGASTGPEHPKMVGDIVRDAVKEGRKLGVKVVVMVGHTANKHLYMLHSDWAQVNSNGDVVLLEHVPLEAGKYEPEWPQLCINSPFIDHVRREVMEALDLGVDGVFLDSFRYQPDSERACYCKWCQERFIKEHGYPMPKEPNWGDSRWSELWEWRYDVVVGRIRELYLEAKRKAPDKVFMYNSHPGGWAGRTNKVVEKGREWMDVVFAECSEADHQPPGFITEMVKLTKAMTGGKPVWASRNYFHLYRTSVSTTPVALKQGLREAVVGGGSPWLLVFSISYKQDPHTLSAAKEVFHEHAVIEDYIDGAEPYLYAGIVISNTTRDHYGRDHPQHYVDEVRGFYYALTHSHIPVEFIAERDLKDVNYLKRFKVIVLPNTVCMDDETVEALKQYVSLGGGVVATYLTSTRGVRCMRRYEFALKELLGVERVAMLRMPWTYLVIDDPNHPVTSGVGKKIILWGDMSYEFTRKRVSPMLGWHTVVRPTTAEVIAHVGLPGGSWGYEYTLGRSPPPMAGVSDVPAILVNKFGEGRAVYFSGQLGRYYWRTGLPEYRELIVNAVKYAGGDPGIEVKAPSTVHAGYFIKGSSFIIHLINHTYNQKILAAGIGSVKQPLPPFGTTEAVHPPSEVIPVRDVKILIKGVRRATVRVPLRGREFAVEGTGEVVVDLDELTEYELVVVNAEGS